MVDATLQTDVFYQTNFGLGCLSKSTHFKEKSSDIFAGEVANIYHMNF